jgi:very-short-patch-repair endonuclease
VTDEHSQKAELRYEIDRRINFAMQQNDVPVVKFVRVENRSNVALQNLHVVVTAQPDFAERWESRVELIAESSTYNLQAVDLVLSPQYLSELTERVRGQLRFELFSEEERLIERVVPVDLLARDEWSGLSSLPEILAAFVMPNHPTVEYLLRDAAEILQKWSGDASLSGYQSRDLKRIYMMAGAIYAALQRLGLTYINPPASFESEGQRIRLPDRIADSKLATCLDLAVLTAACLEQSGLNPLVIVVKGHAFVGFWLQDECFAEPAIDELLRLRKRVDLKEIGVFDPTYVTSRPSPTFAVAVREGMRRLGNTDDFLCAIDVLRARKGRIRPLAERVERAATPEALAGEAASGIPPAPDVPVLDVETGPPPEVPEEAPETPATRLDRWCRRLLDLSLRNRLLNFVETKKTLPFLCPDLPALEDALAEGLTFQILARPRDLAEGDPRDADAYRRRTGDEAIAALLREELNARRLHADLVQEELDRRLLEIYRAARVGLEEGGASALYLALGFLAWYETPQSSQRRLAPILLVPLELNRRSAREGFTLRRGDDEPRLNVTLLELLKRDHGVLIRGLDPLPEDESGLDVPKIFRTFLEAIRDIDRWDVLDIARMGIFSFAKFLMWRDFSERAEDLTKNPVVDHLVNRPDQAFEPGAAFPDLDRLDEERSPADTFCPLPADGSQLRAIFAAADGRSFVLEGPPGTGKSQTITNLIAHCLATGNTVLFVSEKMAALNVVYERLRKVGLGRYCLELHSNKAHKQAVLAQLSAVLDQYGSAAPEDWEREARRLAGLRSELNAYVHALHKKRGTGETVFQANSRLIGLRDAQRVELRWPSPDALDVDQLANLRDLVARLATAGAALGEVSGHCWEPVRRTDWTPDWEEKVRSTLSRLDSAAETLEARAREVSRAASGDGGWSLDRLAFLEEMAGVFLDSPALPTAILVRPNWDEIRNQIESWIEHGRRRDALRAELFEHFSDKILSLQLEVLQQRLEYANGTWWPISWWQRRSVRKALKSVAKGAGAPATEELGPTIETARLLRDEEQVLTAAGDEARALLGDYWKDGAADWDGLCSLLDWVGRFRSLATRAASNRPERAAAFRERWARQVTEGRELLQPRGPTGRKLVAYRSAFEAFRDARTAANTLLDLDIERAWGKPNQADALATIRRRLRSWIEKAVQLRDWCAWRRARAEAVHANLAPLVEAYERGEFRSQDLGRVFDRSYYQWWQTAVVSSEPVLARFFSPEHNRRIGQFRAADDCHRNLATRLIVARLGEKVPAASSADLPNSEVGILKREIGKRRRHMSVRKLFQTIPNLLPRLKPCLLMSPLSVAQYLDTNYPPFDLVVFDEASQIPVWDAVGAIARGERAIIVGDPKQLPPTTFFQRVEGHTEDAMEADEAVEDLESILDECLSARLRWLPLDWHYRSRHESLIAFSNYHYYENRLLTFPSPDREGMGVAWRHVPAGVYDRGKSATNRAEAEAIVAEIVRRLRDAALRRWSIGVVTFSQAQQTLVEDLLEKCRRDDSEIDTFFSEEATEPIFVKNLENVQGDERDVILFSICYGPDALGRVSMNFGPMNKEGGERRLNVAITRARREVLVFSTLRADQIDLARTRARGARDLKNFLEYAERGPSAIAEATQYNPKEDFDSPFEKAVYDVLADKGWEVHQQVGCARYRIDLAVVDAEAPGRYLLGIECDGANYHRARTARDRDKLREGILRELGWNLHRIWSTDWWTNPEQEMRKVEAALQAARAGRYGESPVTGPKVPPAASAARIAAAPVPIPPQAPPVPKPKPVPKAEGPPTYTPYPVKQVLGTQEDFYSSLSDRQIRGLIAEVVKHEGPISLEVATRRVAAHWGFGRVHGKAVARVRRLVPRDQVHMNLSAAGDFLWSVEIEPETYGIFRVPGISPESYRHAKDLPVEEVANAALFLLRQHISAPEEEIVRETSRIFGFHRTGKLVEDRMREGVERLVRRGSARRDGKTIIVEAD